MHITLYPLWGDDPRVPASQFLGLVFPLEKFITHAAQRDSFLSQQQQLFQQQQQQQQQQALSMQSFADMRIPQPFNTSGNVYNANGGGLVNYFQNPIAPVVQSYPNELEAQSAADRLALMPMTTVPAYTAATVVSGNQHPPHTAPRHLPSAPPGGGSGWFSSHVQQLPHDV